ncbi:MAG: DUF4091 domain-containing protein [Brevinema sp.]
MIEVKVLSNLEKVFPKIEPKYDTFPRSFLKNESHSFQVAYNGLNINQRDIVAKYQLNTKGIPKGMEAHIYAVKLIPSEYSSHAQIDDNYLPNYEPGLFPDLLKKIDKNQYFDVRENYWASLWIELVPNKQLVAGIYTIELEFWTESACEKTLSYEFEVIDIDLPEQKLYHTEWFHTDCLCHYYQVEPFSEDYWALIKNYMKVAAEHGINMILTPIFTPPLDTKIGGERLTIQLIDISYKNSKFHFKYDKFRKWVKIAKEVGIRYIEISHLFSQEGAKYAPKIMVHTENGLEYYFGWHTDALSDEYADFLKQFLTDFVKELKDLKLENNCFFHVSDEPLITHLEAYKKAKSIIYPYIKDFPLIDALSDYNFYISGTVPCPIPSTDHIEKFLEANVSPLWTYYCTGQYLNVSNRFFSMPSARTRILAYQLFKYDIQGFLHWGFNFWNTRDSIKSIDPYVVTDAGGHFPSGDSYLVYPGKDLMPEFSLRLKVLYQALNDLRAMQLLEELSSKEEVLKLIDPDNSMSFSKYPKGSVFILQTREKINQTIKSLKK